MIDSVLTPLSGTALFHPTNFYEVNQLADLLFNDEEQAICLKSEHESVTRSWILSALNNSDLSKKASRHPTVYWIATETEAAGLAPNAWIYLDNGKLIRAGFTHTKTTTLHFPPLSLEQRVKILQQFSTENLQTHLLSIPAQTIQQALEWQSRYCADQKVLSETLILLQRAVTRFLLTHADDQPATSLEPQHIAEVLVDWQGANLSDLLRCTQEDGELKSFLSEHIIGQELAIEKFVHHVGQYSLFILTGPRYSGKETFIDYYTQFTHASKYFCIRFNLSYFSGDVAWSEIFLPSPHCRKKNSYLSLIDIVQTYPQAIIMLTHALDNALLLERLQREINRGFFQIEDQCISMAKITWMLTLETAKLETPPTIVQESIFAMDNTLELSDILYRPTLKISEETQEPGIVDTQYVLETTKKLMPEKILSSACILPFVSLSEKDKKQIINNEVKRIIHRLRSAYAVSIYYQEEVIQFLLRQINHANQGFSAFHEKLHTQIEQIFLKALEKGVIVDGQVLMLQLNDTGCVLQIVRTNARSGASQLKLKT
jgi:hypothetical protein